MSTPTKPKEPCGNEDCDKCDPRPWWRISAHRIQHITYEREIKAATAEEAMKIFEAGTAWPSSYDDRDGDIIQQDAPVLMRMTGEDNDIDAFKLSRYQEHCCYHDLASQRSAAEHEFLSRPDEQSGEQSDEDDLPLEVLVPETIAGARIGNVFTHLEILEQSLVEAMHASTAHETWIFATQQLEPLRAAIERAAKCRKSKLPAPKRDVNADLASLDQRFAEVLALFCENQPMHPTIEYDAVLYAAWLEAHAQLAPLRAAIEQAQKRAQGDK